VMSVQALTLPKAAATRRSDRRRRSFFMTVFLG
jgi:hypothetical protein